MIQKKGRGKRKKRKKTEKKEKEKKKKQKKQKEKKEHLLPKGSVVSLGGGSVLAAGVVEHFVDDDFLEIIAESVDAVFVFALLFHQFVRVHALIRHFHSGGL